MRKNKMMRLASALLVAVLLSTSVISGTYAKYVTTGTGSDNARVAKWGVEITPTGTIFSDKYATTDTSRYNGENSVVTLDADTRLVAPGTTGGNTLVQLEGKPEVAYHVGYEATLTLTGWNVSVDLNNDGDKDDTGETGEYCPLIFTVDGTEFKIDGSTITTVAQLKAAVEKAINDCSKSYDPNVELTEANINYPTVTWAWEYGVFENISDNDIKDTYLGDQAADGHAATVSLQVETTVTQVD